MKIRMYVDLLDGMSHESVMRYCYANAALNATSPITAGYKRYYFDLDFPPGTFAEERSTPLPTAAAKEM